MVKLYYCTPKIASNLVSGAKNYKNLSFEQPSNRRRKWGILKEHIKKEQEWKFTYSTSEPSLLQWKVR